MRRLLVPLTILLVLRARARRERVAHADDDLRGPEGLPQPRTRRPGALDELAVARRALAARDHRVVVASRPAPTRPRSPPSSRPTPTPTTGASTSALLAAAKARGWDVLVTISGPGAEVGDGRQARQPHAPEPDGVRRVRHRGRAQVRRPGQHLGDLERAQPAAVPAPAVRRAAARPSRRRSTAACTRPASAGWRTPARATTRSSSPRRRRAATAASSRRCASCAGCSASTRSTRSARKCGALDRRRLRAPRLHDAPGPVLPARRRTDDVTIGVLSRLTKALDRAQAAGALTKRLPIYLTEFGIQSTPDTPERRLARQAGRVPRDLRADRLGNPRVVAFSQYLLRDSDPTGKNQYGGFESGLRFADGRPKPSLPAFRLPLAVKRDGLAGRRSGASCARRPASTDGDDHLRRPRLVVVQDPAHRDDGRARLLHRQARRSARAGAGT